MKKIYTWVLMLSIVFGLTQCSKTSNEEDPTPAPGVTKTELLAGKSLKTWVMISSKIDGKEVFNQSLVCSRDDHTIYRTDKTYEVNEGETKCYSQDPQTYEKGTWSFNTDETELIINNEQRFKILELNNTTLRLSIKTLFGETIERTFKKI
ncbi:hypothetical protein GVN20_09895 [Runella sp. CRIBMP]|uniref:lipocalin family protein n=1 Tax=Runella sp. CRIBMP TaxID=2683261 RepID=UPI0014134DEC|nr:lipocalin family protein [Runella sp. CRIBMP]NBB19663.1 hypothetical protein [Runella sp. CRIBMP]